MIRITVAALDEECHPAVGQGAQGGTHAHGQLRIIVVADPDIEQVAKDEQAVAGLRVCGEKPLEQGEGARAFDRQVQVGDEPLLRHRRGL